MSERVSISLRALGYQLCRAPGLKQMGQCAYLFCARQIAESLFRVPGVRAVAWRGGALDRCVPAVSDLDFTLWRKEEEDSLIPGDIYRRLKRRYPMLGELLVTTPERWSRWLQSGSATVRPFVRFRPFEAKKFSPPREVTAKVASSQSDFMVKLGHFARAAQYRALSFRQYHGYYLAQYRKEIKKAGGHDLNSALMALDSLARTSTDADPTIEVFSSKLSDAFVEESLVQDWLAHEVTKTPGLHGISPTPVPFLFLTGTPDSDQIVRFFDLSLRLCRTSAPVLLTPAMWELYQRGWAPGAALVKLRAFGLLKKVSLRCLKEKLIASENLLPGLSLSSPKEAEIQREEMLLAKELLEASFGARTPGPI